MTRTTKTISLMLALVMIASCVFAFAACDNKNNITYYNNETDKLVFSTQEVDKVFNPFFSTSGTDSNVVGMTQISMLANDADGNAVWGDSQPVVTKDLQILTEGTADVDQTTTYYFVLKNNVKFSNGSALTIKDVLFNLYVYLDPVYTGSSTIYSTDIVGLAEYRTQTANEKEQQEYETKYKIAAMSRVNSLVEAAEKIVKDHPEVNVAEMEGYLNSEWKGISSAYENVVKDFQKAQSLFMEELTSDYNNCLDSYQDQLFTDQAGEVHRNLFTTDVEMFLYNEGIITWSKKDGKLSTSLGYDPSEHKTWTREQAIEAVYQTNMPGNLAQILQYWNTSVTLYDYITKEEMEKDQLSGGQLDFPNISGIKFANFDTAVTVNGNSYDIPQYNEDGSVKEGSNEVLSITINNVDPKAIWNFAFAVAPLYYYSDEEHISGDKAFSYAENRFGVERSSQTFMETVVKNPDKIGVPVGAGPYAASKSSGGISNIKAGDFYDKGVIYFERNPYFIMGPAKIKKVRFQVVSTNSMLDSLYTNAVDFAEPNAKPETTAELDTKKSMGLDYKRITTLGYGYIGVNAGKVPNVYVRRAIMYAVDTSMTVSYYQTLAKPIYRSMSRNSWAYPENCVAYYPYVGGPIPEDLTNVDPDYAYYVSAMGYRAGYTMKEDEQLAFIKWLMEDMAGYSIDGNGYYAEDGKNECKFEFTIAGQETDHPAYGAMLKAAELLNKVGFNVTVRTDKDALSKLASGALTVWAAAWGSTIDPDMYQVYHKDSTATSVLNWGYKQIALNPAKYAYETGIIEELSLRIEEARATNDQNRRAQIYSDALDLVMQLAVELPTYQRNDLFAYNALKIDATTFNQNANAFKGLTSDIHTISLIVEK